MPLCPWRLRRAAQVCLQVDLTHYKVCIICNTSTWKKEINEQLSGPASKSWCPYLGESIGGPNLRIRLANEKRTRASWDWDHPNQTQKGCQAGLTFDGNRYLWQIGSGGLVILPTYMISGQDLWKTIQRGTFYLPEQYCTLWGSAKLLPIIQLRAIKLRGGEHLSCPSVTPCP